jgi:hypothetical protein
MRQSKWKVMAYVLDIGVSTAQISLKKAKDTNELGEKPIIK